MFPDWLAGALAGAAAGAVFGTVFPYVWQWMHLTRALQVEAYGTLCLLDQIRQAVEETAQAAEEVLGKIRQNRPIAPADFDRLSSGWVISPPRVDFHDMVTRLPHEEDGKAVAAYLDYWYRLIEYERRYAGYLDRLLALLGEPKQNDGGYSLEIHEQAARMAGCAQQIRKLRNGLAKRAVEMHAGNFNLLPCTRKRNRAPGKPAPGSLPTKASDQLEGGSSEDDA
jgi:hypothetical protein